MKKLEELLNISDIDPENINDIFREIAETLMTNYIIKKGEKRYAIIEIEFYLYTPQHKDFITYPRNLEAGRWFFHESGVDLTFKTDEKPSVLKIKDKNKKDIEKLIYKDCSFGGILIRGLYQFSWEDKELIDHNARYIFGPQKVVNELWDDFDALKVNYEEYPIVTEASEENIKIRKDLVRHKRHIKIGKDKQKKKVYDWAERLGFNANTIEIDLKKKIDEYNNELFNPNINSYLYRFFNIIDGDNTWDAIKHLTKTEKKELK